MKRRIRTYWLPMLVLAFCFIGSMSSCKVKEGCDVETSLRDPIESGKMSKKRGTTTLFDKKRVAKSKKRKG